MICCLLLMWVADPNASLWNLAARVGVSFADCGKTRDFPAQPLLDPLAFPPFCRGSGGREITSEGGVGWGRMRGRKLLDMGLHVTSRTVLVIRSFRYASRVNWPTLRLFCATELQFPLLPTRSWDEVVLITRLVVGPCSRTLVAA